jgi:hypothetical protein
MHQDEKHDTRVTAAKVAGRFVIVAAIISGLFLLFNTLLQQELARAASTSPSPDLRSSAPPSTPSPPSVSASPSLPESAPPALTFTVDSQLGWQDTGIELHSGGRVLIEVSDGSWTSAGGTLPLNAGDGSGYICAEAAIDASGCKELLPTSPQGALIGRVSPQVFHVGSKSLIVIGQAGALELRMNDDPAGLSDNAGQLTVSITLVPDQP